jgi:hypothetical protein
MKIDTLDPPQSARRAAVIARERALALRIERRRRVAQQVRRTC